MRLRAAGAWSGPGCPDEDEGPSPLRTGRCWAPAVSLVSRGTQWRGGQLAGWTLQPLSPLVFSPDSVSAPASRSHACWLLSGRPGSQSVFLGTDPREGSAAGPCC